MTRGSGLGPWTSRPRAHGSRAAPSRPVLLSRLDAQRPMETVSGGDPVVFLLVSGSSCRNRLCDGVQLAYRGAESGPELGGEGLSQVLEVVPSIVCPALATLPCRTFLLDGCHCFFEHVNCV